MKSAQMKYLLAFLRQPESKRKQSAVARIFGVNKSTISRAISEAAEEGILIMKEGDYVLTPRGNEYVSSYERDLDLVTSYLVGIGVEDEAARNDAYNMLDYCSRETLGILLDGGKINRMYSRFRHCRNKKNLTGREIEPFFDEGTYSFPFVFCKTKRKRRSGGMADISMANDAFRHPASLVISPGGSYVALGLKDVVQRSGTTGKEMEGHLDALSFDYLESEKLLYGYIEVILSCSVGKLHMPESSALFVIYLR